MKQMIIKVDDDFAGFPEGLKLSTCGQLVGSRSYYNKILILVLSPYGILEIGNKLDDLKTRAIEMGEPEIDFDYSVIAIEDEPLDIDEFANYMNDISVLDDEGEQIDSVEFSDLSTIQTFAGHQWTL